MFRPFQRASARAWAAMGAGFASVLMAAGLLSAGLAAAEPMTSIAMHGVTKYGRDFQQLDYVDAAAPQGGRLTLGVAGTFDSVNPYIVKGVAAAGLSVLTYETLMFRSLDEPFSLYGLIAKSLEVADDRSWVSFTLDERARFSDGERVNPEDVIFSFEVLRDHGRPNHRSYYKKVSKAEALDGGRVRFSLVGGDREMPLILGLMPVLPKHRFRDGAFQQTSLQAPVGSGPYKVARVDGGRAINFVKDPNYWGRGLAVNRGRFNFEEVRFEYFRDMQAMFEAFKAGALDLRIEEEPNVWAEGYDLPAVAQGRMKKREIELGVPAGMTGLAFNTRRAVMRDRRVREALILLFDFEWMNRNLFHGLYRRTESYFARSVLAASGHPASAAELALLAAWPQVVKPEVLAGDRVVPVSPGDGQNRDNQRRAVALLQTAGYELKDGLMVERQSGRRLAFEILAANAAQERVLGGYVADLQRVGISARVRLVDSAQYQARLKTYDYDVVQAFWPSSLSPGNEQSFRWSGAAARVEGSFNYVGVDEPAVDAMIAAMLAASKQEDFVAAVRALDRVLLSGAYVIPLFHLPRQWVAHWARVDGPAQSPLSGLAFETWWRVGDRP